MAEGMNRRLLYGRGAVIAAWVISSAVFSVLHAFNPESSLVSTANLFVAGLILGTGYVLTGSLAIPIGLHITWNISLGNVYGFPVSGLAVPSQFATVVATELAGPALWTGGAFGPEAGLLGLLMCVTGILATVWWVRFRYGGVGIAAGLADYQHPAAAEAVEPSMDSGESNRGDSLMLADRESK
jgi:hypothetical protein